MRFCSNCTGFLRRLPLTNMAIPGHTNERADRIFGPSLIANYLFPAGKRLPEILRSVFEFARKFALILSLLTGSRYCLAQDDQPITITPLAPPAIYPDSGNG